MYMLKGVQTMTRMMLDGDMMTNIEQFEKWKDKVYPVLLSKAEEFHFYGYDTVTTDDVWKCVLEKAKRRKTDYMLHEFVAEIFRLSAHEYMNWLTIQAVTSTDLSVLENENDLLLGLD